MAERKLVDPRTKVKWTIRQHTINANAVVITIYEGGAYFMYDFANNTAISLRAGSLWESRTTTSFEDFIKTISKEMIKYGKKK